MTDNKNSNATVNALAALACSLLSVASIAFAKTPSSENYGIGINLGTAFIDNSDYENGFNYDAYGHLTKGSFLLGVGALGIKDLDLKETDDSLIEVKGAYFSLGQKLEFDKFDLELGAGYLFSSTEAYLLGRRVADDSDQSPFLDAKAIFYLSDYLGLVVDWKYIHDVSGANINLTQIGVRFSF